MTNEKNLNDKEELKIETRTLEELLKNLREEKGWSYIHIVENLNKIGYFTDEKKVKKWEIGIEYPDIDAIYKLSELYRIQSTTFIMAKNNSLKQGLESIHMRAIKWMCYFTGISINILCIVSYIFIGLALIGSLKFFIDMTNNFLEVRRG